MNNYVLSWGYGNTKVIEIKNHVVKEFFHQAGGNNNIILIVSQPVNHPEKNIFWTVVRYGVEIPQFREITEEKMEYYKYNVQDIFL